MQCKLLFALFPLLLLASGLPAQTPDPPSIKITVHDPGNAPIRDALIGVDTLPATLHTAQDGTATLAPTGQTLELHIAAPGFQSKDVSTELFAKIDIALMPAVGTQGSTLTLAAGQEKSFDPVAFAALPHQTLTVENGHTHAKESYSGVALIDLLALLGAPAGAAVKGKALGEYIVATGSDGYKAVLALAEIEPGFHPGTVMVADSLDGKPLDAKEGPWKLVVSEDAKPARSVHNLVRVEVKQAQ